MSRVLDKKTCRFTGNPRLRRLRRVMAHARSAAAVSWRENAQLPDEGPDWSASDAFDLARRLLDECSRIAARQGNSEQVLGPEVGGRVHG